MDGGDPSTVRGVTPPSQHWDIQFAVGGQTVRGEGEVPHNDGTIFASTGDPVPVGRDVEGPELAAVAAKRLNVAARPKIPKTNGSISAGRNEGSATGQELEAADPGSM